MADNDNVTTATQAGGSLLADPEGWTSKPASSNKIAAVLAAAVGTKTTNIQNVLEESNSDQYVFSSKGSGADVFYLFSSGGAETYHVKSPSTKDKIWAVLGKKDWIDQLTLEDA